MRLKTSSSAGTRSAPVTPDSIHGASIRMTASFNETCFDQQCSQSYNQKSLPNELLQSMIYHESLPYYQLNPEYIYSQGNVSERCRRRTCEWMYDICDHFKLNREVVAIAIFYVDRYFTLTHSSEVPVPTRQFQLVALTSLFMAIKVHGEKDYQVETDQDDSIEFNLSFCASISRNQFTPQEIECCEQSLLQLLDWHVNPVVTSNVIDALTNYLSLTSAHPDAILSIYECAKHLAELAVSVPALSIEHKPSVIAFASILYALDVWDIDSVQLHAEFQAVLREAFCSHFDVEEETIENVFAILHVICPDLRKMMQDSIGDN